jgi:8-oxo-dGTP pyrophosphatase MutT (NUDIX family)
MTKYADIPSPFYRVTLKALIFDAQKRLLLVQTAEGLWEVPGGGWEHGESMQHCIRREVMEELGVGVLQINFGTMYPYNAKSQRGYEALKLAVPVVLEDDQIIPGDGMVAFKYVTPQELASVEMDDGEAGIKLHIDRIWPSGPKNK